MDRDLQKNGRLPHEQELDMGKEKIVVPTIFEVSAALDEHKIAELLRFVCCYSRFEIWYHTDTRSGYTKGSGCIVIDSGYKLKIHKLDGPELLIPLDRVKSLRLNKLELN